MKISALQTALTVVITAAVASPLAMAGNNKTTQSNGKPFAEIHELIEENRSLIDANTDDIANLQLESDELRSLIAANTDAIAALEAEVADNDADIASLQRQVRSNTRLIATVRAQLLREIRALQTNITRLTRDIAVLRRQQTVLSAQIRAVSARLSAETAALRAAVDDNAISIDGLLIDVAALNADLTTLNAAYINLDSRVSTQESGLATQTQALADLSAEVDSLSTRLTHLEDEFDGHEHDGGVSPSFSGVRNNVPLAEISDWSVCYQDTYGTRGVSLASITAGCNKANVMIACKVTGSDTLQVAAHAARQDVFFNTGDRNNVTHNANGVEWYYSESWSMGFAPQGEAVSRNSCDTTNRTSNDRICYHTSGGNLNGGWRCGANTSLNSSSAYERVILHRD